MKAITPVIATVMLMLITVGMVGMTYTWFSSMMTTQTEKNIAIPVGGVQCVNNKISAIVTNSGANSNITDNDIVVADVNGVSVKNTPFFGGFNTNGLVGYWKLDDEKILLADQYPNFPSWSDARTSTCGSYGLMGGFNLFGNGAYTQKAIDLPAGRYRINFTFFKIDSWDGESGRLFYNGNQIWSKSYGGDGSQLCGQSYGGWNEFADPISVEFDHAGGSATFKFDSTLDSSPNDESWGVNNIVIRKLEAPDATNNNGGTVYGAVWTDGKFGKALNFDGVDDYVNAGQGASLNITNELTIATWVRMEPSAETFHMLVDKNWGNGYALLYRDTKSLSGYYSGGSGPTYYAVSTGANAFNWDEWTHVAYTFTTSSAKIYVNGVQAASKVPEGNIGLNPTTNLRIGASLDGDYRFNGTIDEVMVWNRALTPDEITQLNKTNAGNFTMAPNKAVTLIKGYPVSAKGKYTVRIGTRNGVMERMVECL